MKYVPNPDRDISKAWNWKAKADSKPWNGFQYPAETLTIEEALDKDKKKEKGIKTAAEAGKTDVEDVDHNKQSDDSESGKDVDNKEEEHNNCTCPSHLRAALIKDKREHRGTHTLLNRLSQFTAPVQREKKG